MWIERLQVEPEGFLKDLDIEFAPGLNVLIGARGTGKTSIIELLRWCLHAPGFTLDAAARGEQQSLAILGGAAATTILRDGNDRLEFTRAEGPAHQEYPDKRPPLTVLAQNEMEAIGAQASGRLFLIDRFRTESASARREASALRSTLVSLTSELRVLRNEGAEITQQLQQMRELPTRLAETKRQQSALLSQASASTQDQNQLTTLDMSAKRLAARQSVLSEAITQTREVLGQSDSLYESLSRIAESGWARSGANSQSGGPSSLGHALAAARTTAEHLTQLLQQLDLEFRHIAQQKDVLDVESRALRQKLDSMQSGLGAITRTVHDLEERTGQLEALEERLEERRRHYAQLQEERAGVQARLATLRESVTSQRDSIAQALNAQLGPQIRTQVIPESRLEEYEAALIAAFRGSGIHYNSIVPQIARAVAPYELATWAERNEISSLAQAIGIAEDRSAAMLLQLRRSGMGELLAAVVEDEVVLELLDGKEYKPSDCLSIGQRCTVVLPILLAHHSQPLIIDQPEDHLDNAFVAGTVVKSLQRRQTGDQYILASHNANIPVLANADRVIVMDSDGDRGFVRHAGGLDDPEIVAAITDLMEGGREAFETRARFYGGAG